MRSYPGLTAQTISNPDGVLSGVRCTRTQPRWGCGPMDPGTQGSSCLATLGWRLESLRDSPNRISAAHSKENGDATIEQAPRFRQVRGMCSTRVRTRKPWAAVVPSGISDGLIGSKHQRKDAKAQSRGKQSQRDFGLKPRVAQLPWVNHADHIKPQRGFVRCEMHADATPLGL